MSLLARGQAALAARLKVAGATSGTLTYVRLAGGSVDVTGKAWVGQTMYRVSDSTAQARVVWSDRDYLILAVDLALTVGGTPFEPARGDYFVEVLPAPGGTQRFEVMPYNDEPESRYSDPQRTTLRIHTKRVANAG